ncbi:MAG: hypothetical protein AMXMBFR84_05320 [Candidatus Hydrogenedentota bacterium]
MKKALYGMAILAAAIATTKPAFGSKTSGEASLERVAAAVVQTALSFVMETNVVLDSVSVDPMSGELNVLGVHIANPKGFPEEDAVVFDRISVLTDLSTFASGEPVIHRIQASGVSVTVRHDLKRGVNLAQLQKSAVRLQKQVRRLPVAPPSSTASLQLKKGVLDQCRVKVGSPLLLEEQEVFSLDTIEIDYETITGGKAITVDRAIAIALEKVLESVAEETGIKIPGI